MLTNDSLSEIIISRKNEIICREAEKIINRLQTGLFYVEADFINIEADDTDWHYEDEIVLKVKETFAGAKKSDHGDHKYFRVLIPVNEIPSVSSEIDSVYRDIVGSIQSKFESNKYTFISEDTIRFDLSDGFENYPKGKIKQYKKQVIKMVENQFKGFKKVQMYWDEFNMCVDFTPEIKK